MNSKSLILNKTTKETFLQRTLGDNYKWFFLIKYWIKANTAYFWSEVFIGLNRTLTLLGTCVIFLYLGQNQQPILNYLLLGSIFFAITDPVMAWFVSGDIKYGKITKWLMYPAKYINILFFIAIANCLYLSLTCLVGLIPVVLLFHQNINLSGNFWVFIPFILTSFVIRFSLQILTGFSAFWFIEGTGLTHLMQNAENFLSGSMFPLFILPFYFNWLQFLPFAFTFYHPMQIYLGKYDNFQTFLVFLGGVSWCILLYFLARFVFKMGLKRNESVGL